MNTTTTAPAPNHYWALLKPFSIVVLWITLAIVFYMAVTTWLIFGREARSEYSLNGFYPAFIYVMLVCFSYEFMMGGSLFQQKGNTTMGMLAQQTEFLFTRAISRESIYWAKVTTYFIGASIPILVLAGWTLTQPVAKIELSYKEKTRAMQQAFYTRNFENVQIVGAKDTRYAVIPEGRQAKAVTLVLNIFAFIVVYQYIQHLARNQVWIQRGLYILCVMLPGFWPIFERKLLGGTHDNDDQWIAWVYQHWVVYALAVLIFGACVQYVCRRAFLSRETPA